MVDVFETAVEAVIAGDEATLTRLLREHPDLIHARSARGHRATLLHYVGANGVEGERQISPKNSARIAQILIDAGAEVDATAPMYNSDCTTLGLVATSVHPYQAGVQREVIDVLLDRGARMDLPGSAGNNQTLLRACLANGRPEAAEYLLSRGAPVELLSAAGVGRLDLVRPYFDDHGQLRPGTTRAQLLEGFDYACAFGRAEVVEFLLDHGVDVNEEVDRGRHTGLHSASYGGQLAIVESLLRRGARVDVLDETYHTTPLVWALTAWDRKKDRRDPYYAIVSRLVDAGSTVTRDVQEWDKAQADPRMRAALSGTRPSTAPA